MQQIRSVSCGDTYTDAATLADIPDSSGGYFVIEGNQALVQLEYGKYGDFKWQTGEAQVPLGNGVLQAGTSGIRFRNAVAGSVAVVTAAIYESVEPALIVTAGGLATPSSSSMITGIVASNGSIVAGTGFTVNRTGAGVYAVTFSTAFAAQPVIVAEPLTNPAIARGDYVSSPSVSGFTFTFNGALDIDWNFLAVPVT